MEENQVKDENENWSKDESKDKREKEQTGEPKPMDPLADPVLEYAFRNAEVSGLAMRELANATLADSGDEVIDEVISVTPQTTIKGTRGERSFKLDVFARTSGNRFVLLEVQLRRQAFINTRTHIHATKPLKDAADSGDTWGEIAEKLPRVVSINILDFEIRTPDRNFHQVIESTYRESPHEVADNHITTHNIELPKFRRTEKSMENPLHCWLTALCDARDKVITMKEAVAMNEILQKYADANPGFTQFMQQYELANADRETRTKYDMWMVDTYLDELEKRKIAEDARTEGADAMETVIRMLKNNRDISEIRAATNLPDERILNVMEMLGG
jgi:predicted transposase/invertase (TIGR01784 family)